MPFHGEANRQTMKVIASHDAGPVHLVTMQSTLPLALETLTRTVQVADGESVIDVISQLASALTVDRHISWAEHATIGPPFLEKGKVVVDMPATNCRVRPYKPGAIPGHLVYDKDFKWPMAHTNDGGQADIRVIPSDHNWLDLASCQMDTRRRLEFVTALHVEKHLVYGYGFRREDYSWLMSWMNFTGDDRAARGMEFSSQPFDISHLLCATPGLEDIWQDHYSAAGTKDTNPPDDTSPTWNPLTVGRRSSCPRNRTERSR